MAGFYWLSSYPKSGNTWLRLMLWSLYEGGKQVDFNDYECWATLASSRADFDDFLDVESSDLSREEIERLRPWFYEQLAHTADGPQFRKVHDALVTTAAGRLLFPPEATLGAVYVARDPRDVAISYAHHANQSIDQSIDMLEDEGAIIGHGVSDISRQLPQPLLSWNRHVTSWLDAQGMRVLLVRYEDMLADPEGELARVAEHVGWRVEREAIARAVAATRFELLREQEQQYGFREKPMSSPSFFRRGIAGGWSEILTPEQTARVETAHGAVMKRLGYLTRGDD